MLYELSHFIKEHLSWAWEAVECLNAEIFGIQHRKMLRKIPAIIEAYNGRFVVVSAGIGDVPALVRFFAGQPNAAYEFFRPHNFDAETLAKLVRRKSFLMFVVKDSDDIVGYFFLRCFANGTSFKGRIVDYRHRNQGMAKIMGSAINDIVLALNLRLFTTISPDNYASLSSTKAVNDIKIVRTLQNGYYYIECTPKSDGLNGGGI